ncbi:hypothetical protein [Nostoc sp.]|uniref:hypothetical protein n=1 Tax=Nostoc sp. TaxID=1180 RepID=UPI002FF7B9B1
MEGTSLRVTLVPRYRQSPTAVNPYTGVDSQQRTGSSALSTFKSGPQPQANAVS